MSPIAPVDFFVSLGLRVFVFHLLDVMKELSFAEVRRKDATQRHKGKRVERVDHSPSPPLEPAVPN